jgi:hypothetical protein
MQVLICGEEMVGECAVKSRMTSYEGIHVSGIQLGGDKEYDLI